MVHRGNRGRTLEVALYLTIASPLRTSNDGSGSYDYGAERVIHSFQTVSLRPKTLQAVSFSGRLAPS